MVLRVFIAGRFVGLASVLIIGRRAWALTRWSLITVSFATMAVTARRAAATSASPWTTESMRTAPSTRASPSVRTKETWTAKAFKAGAESRWWGRSARVLKSRSWLVDTSSGSFTCIHRTDEFPERD